MQGQFANCLLLVFSLLQVCSRSSSPHLCSISKSYHVMPCLTSHPTRAASPTQLHRSSCKSCQPYSTSPVVLQELPALLNFIGRPARAASPTQLHTSRPTRAASPTQLHTSRPTRAASPTQLHTSRPTRAASPTQLHRSSHKNSHILHYFTGCPTRTPTSYTTSLVVPQELPHPTLLHQLSYKSSHILHYLTSCLQELPGCDQRNSASVTQRTTVFVNLRTAVSVIILKNNEC